MYVNLIFYLLDVTQQLSVSLYVFSSVLVF